MQALLLGFVVATTTARAQTRPCDVKQSEQQVREVIQRVMALRSRQDDHFLAFYAGDEYSFPGESWVFRGQERSAQRTRDTRSARHSGTRWQMELRDVHLTAGCDMAWMAAILHVQQVDSGGKPTLEAQWRLTAILERLQSGWLIVHQHSSLPVSDPQQWWKRVQ